MAHHSSAESDDKIPPQPLELKKPHQPKDNIIVEQEQEDESDKDDTQTPSSSSKPHLSNNVEIALQELVLPDHAVDVTKESVEPETMAEDSGRERLKRHRVEVAGKVWIPDTWDQEEMLKDWVDCTMFDAPLVPSRIITAKTTLVEEGRRASDGALRIEEKGVEFSFM